MPAAPRAGIGLRHPHVHALLARRPPLGFVEVHAENHFADGGASVHMLDAVRQHWPVSLHAVGLGLGSAAGLDTDHLTRLAQLARRVDAFRVSDHACFARVDRGPDQPPVHANDLLPLAFTDAALELLCRHVDQAQQALQRPMLVEHLAAVLAHRDDQWPEPDFLVALCRRTGCGLLLDVNNLLVNALNAGVADPLAHGRAWMDALPARGVVGEIHLAGHLDRRADGDPLVIDDHGRPVCDAVWALHAHALRRFGAVPSLVEWDTRLPALDVLLAEAHRAEENARRWGGDPGPDRFGPPGTADLPWCPPGAWLAQPGPVARRGPTAPTAPIAAPFPPPTPFAPPGPTTALRDEAQRQRELLALLDAGWAPAPGPDSAPDPHAAPAPRPDPPAGSRAGSSTALEAQAADPWRAGVAGVARGLAAHRANRAERAARALASRCPTLVPLLGDEAWPGLARAFWAAHPPTSGDLGRWGDALPGWLARQPSLAEWPWLADVARLDLAVHAAERAADAPSDAESLGLLAEVDPARLRLSFVPGTALLRSDHPVVSLRAAHADGAPDAAALARLQRRLARGQGESALVWRPGGAATSGHCDAAPGDRHGAAAGSGRPSGPSAAQVARLDAPTAEFTGVLLAGASLGLALERWAHAVDFSAWLRQALTWRCVKGLTVVGDQPAE